MPSSDPLADSLALAVACYLKDRPDAVAHAGAWLDDAVREWLTRPAGEIAAAATAGLEALDDSEMDRVELLQAELNLQSARSGSFATAAGSLADFLAEMGEAPDVLDES